MSYPVQLGQMEARILYKSTYAVSKGKINVSDNDGDRKEWNHLPLFAR
jgi:hypothetical protein